ncbi:hypothetical protein SAMN06265355_108335 [Actinomadura mexicana]|uniref:Phage L5-like integrase N-terminal domain-containing protein n=1 Tax=Actinomadura mexicana TaxID=134959 RepID=A0A239ABC0_9ACTN|nr:hypothetical protein SAMN06265355_108335 [Actinomadura mexicana]
MANRQGKRRFGSIRELPSGRFQVRYLGPDGKMRSAGTTYPTKREAERQLSLLEAKLVTGDWTDPQRAKVKLSEYAAKWIKSGRNSVRARSRSTRAFSAVTSLRISAICHSARSTQRPFVSGGPL